MHLTLNLTVVSYAITAVVLYYLALFAESLLSKEHMVEVSAAARARLFVILIPARNEELVIEETLRSQLLLEHDHYLLVVLNDGSTDSTSQIARHVADDSDGRVVVIDRDLAIAGVGKSSVLNHGYRLIEELVSAGDPRIAGRSSEEIIVGILDADGRLDQDALGSASNYFDDARVGSVQLGVQIANAATNMIARLQDMEFVAFSFLVQVARDTIGSSGLGGNGQFTRLSALESLGGEPWKRTSLTEDLDLGLSLVERGWRTRFCRESFVHQQGLTEWRPLLRQRTRWIQGHYQCWSHIPAILRSKTTPWRTRLDLVAYLVLVVTVVIVCLDLAIGIAGSFGLLHIQNEFMDFLSADQQRYVQFLIGVVPVTAFLFTYQRHSDAPLSWWSLPAFGLAFTLYSYMWVLATLRAWARIATGQWGWVKTPRVAAEPALSAKRGLRVELEPAVSQ